MRRWRDQPKGHKMSDDQSRLREFARELFGTETDPLDVLVANQADAEYEASSRAPQPGPQPAPAGPDPLLSITRRLFGHTT